MDDDEAVRRRAARRARRGGCRAAWPARARSGRRSGARPVRSRRASGNARHSCCGVRADRRRRRAAARASAGPRSGRPASHSGAKARRVAPRPGALPAVEELVDRRSSELRDALLGRRGLRVQAARDAPGAVGEPAGLDAERGSRAPSSTGSSAREIALAHSTASQPSSIASAASEAVPTPASRITGHAGALADQAQVVGVQQAHARSRSASRAASPRRSRRPPGGGRGSGRRSCTGSTMKPSSTSSSAASSSAGASGSSVRSSPITSSLTQSVSNASRASLRGQHRVARGEAAGGVRAAAATPARVEHVDDRAALRPGRCGAARR